MALKQEEIVPSRKMPLGVFQLNWTLCLEMGKEPNDESAFTLVWQKKIHGEIH